MIVYKLGGEGRLILNLHMLETVSDTVQEDTIKRDMFHNKNMRLRKCGGEVMEEEMHHDEPDLPTR